MGDPAAVLAGHSVITVLIVVCRSTALAVFVVSHVAAEHGSSAGFSPL